MDFYAVLDHVLDLLRYRRKVTYKALQLQFNLDEGCLAALKEELLYAYPQMVDDEGRGLVWTGETPPPEMGVRHGITLGFSDIVTLVMARLQQEKRLTYAALKHIFGLDNATLDVVRQELIFAKRVAADEHGRVLVWTHETSLALSTPSLVTSTTDFDALITTTPGMFPISADIIPTLPMEEGVPEAADRVVPHTPALRSSAPEAERRQVTVLFCDLVNSTRLSQHLDAEDYRAVVRAYQEAAVAAIRPWDGYVAQYLGDGLMAYFGWPRAHEDAATRAVHASLAMLAAMGPLNTRLEVHDGVLVQVRLGLHTGMAVIGEMGSGGRHEQLAMGDTPNIAARIQGVAAPDTVAISAATARLVQYAFVLDDLGVQTLKGVTEPLRVYCVRSPLTSPHDDENRGHRGVPFLVGRDEEMGLLVRRWEQSKAGLGQVVLLSGEAGIGKSSLVETLRAQVREEHVPRIAFRCSPYHTNTALYPVLTHLERLLRFERHDLPETKLARLEQALQTSSLPLHEVVPLIAALLTIPLDGRYAPLRLSPEQQKRQTLDALVTWLFEEAGRQPVLTVWEDLHWADPSTLEFLGLVVEQAPTVPMLHVLTYRPEFVPPWPIRSHLTPITLNRLEQPQVEALIAHLVRGKALPVEVIEYIVAKTDGVPLFVEELTKMLLESALLHEEADHYALTGPLSAVTIPATLQDSLMARLDQLNAAKEVAQLGAMLGREFSYEMLQGLAMVEEATLQEGLAQLVAAELLYQRGRPPRARYIFKHALIQDAAYTSLLRSTRQQIHQRVARLLEERFAEVAETQPELLAYHYTAAGHHEPAFAYWRKAGEQAQARSAYVEAIAHLQQGLELLTALADTPERMQRELELHMTLASAYHASKGQAAPEVEQTYTRARQLCEHLGDDQQLFYVLMGLYRNYGGRGQGQKALEAVDALCQIAQRTQDPHLLVEAHMAQGTIKFTSGQLAAGRDHLEQAMARYTSADHRFYVAHSSLDPGVTSLSRLSWALWLLGYPEQALVRSQQTLMLAHDLGHVHSLAMACSLAAILHQLRGDDVALQEQVEAATALATRHHLQQWLEQAAILRGWYLARHGQSAASVAQMQQAVTTYRKRHALYQVWFLALLAEVYGQHGQSATALEQLDEAFALAAHNTFDSCWEPELHRRKGVLLLTQPPPNHAEAETCFLAALDLARRQQAKAWELRAATSLSRLWQQQGKRQAAHDLLAPVYGWFTEGFDTADVQTAKGLLEELRH